MADESANEDAAREARRSAGRAGAPAAVLEARLGADKLADLRARFAKLKVPQLKELLAANGLSRTGAKAELVGRCVEGAGLGVPPMCPLCGHARTRTAEDGVFVCPGYFDRDAGEVKRCDFDGPGQRTAWINADGEPELGVDVPPRAGDPAHETDGGTNDECEISGAAAASESARKASDPVEAAPAAAATTTANDAADAPGADQSLASATTKRAHEGEADVHASEPAQAAVADTETVKRPAPKRKRRHRFKNVD